MDNIKFYQITTLSANTPHLSGMTPHPTSRTQLYQPPTCCREFHLVPCGRLTMFWSTTQTQRLEVTHTNTQYFINWLSVSLQTADDQWQIPTPPMCTYWAPKACNPLWSSMALRWSWDINHIMMRCTRLVMGQALLSQNTGERLV